MTPIAPFNPHRVFTQAEKEAIVADPRTSAVLAILYGVTRTRINSIRMRMFKRFAGKN